MSDQIQIDEHTSFFQTGAVIAGRYEVISLLGKGGMGMVLRVIDRALDNEPTALKILYPHHVEDKVIFARFRNEVLVARALAHPNIVRLYDFGSAGKGYYYLSMEFIQGYSLKDRIYSPKLPELTFPEICRILYEIGQGLSYAHKKGVIHRDMKPDNILLTPGGDVRISDFGLARTVAADKGFTQTGETVGTPCYMAPEQINGSTVDGRADIYSLGILAFEMATGTRPFEDESWFTLAKMHMTKPIPSFANDYNLPKWFEDLVSQSAAKRPDDRFQSAEEFCDEIVRHVNPAGNKHKKLSPAVFSVSFAKTLSSQKKRKDLCSKWAKKAVVLAFGTMLSIAFVLGVRSAPTLQNSTISAVTSLERATNTRMDVIKRLFGLGVPVTSQSLLKAVQDKDLAKSALLVSAGVDITSADNKGVPILFKALESRWDEFILKVASRPGVVSLKDSSGRSIFFRAVEQGSSNLIQPLLTAGADINERDSDGRTPIMVASLSGDFSSVQELIARGALLSLKDSTREETPIAIYAVKGGSPQVLSALLAAGGVALANSADKRAMTPLMYAAQNDDEDLIKILLAGNADSDRVNVLGKSARDFASGKIRQTYFRQDYSKTTDSSSTISGATLRETKLRVIDKPDPEWIHGRFPRLRSLEVSVRNVGSQKATGVRVEAILPGGQVIPVSGPGELDANEIVVYKPRLVNPIPVQNIGRVDIRISCDNCRK